MIIFTIIGVIVVAFIVIDWVIKNSQSEKLETKVVINPPQKIPSKIFFVLVFDTKIKSEMERTEFHLLDDAERYFASSSYDISSPQYSFFLVEKLENNNLKIINFQNVDPNIFKNGTEPYYADFIESQTRKSKSLPSLTRSDFEKLISVTRRRLLDIYYNPEFFDEEKKVSDEFEASIISILIITGVMKFNENTGDSYENYIFNEKGNKNENLKFSIIAESEFYMENAFIKDKILNCLPHKNLDVNNLRVLFFLYLNSRIPLYSFPINAILNSEKQDDSYYENLKMISNYHGRPFENFNPYTYPSGIPNNESLDETNIILSIMLVQEFFKFNR